MCGPHTDTAGGILHVSAPGRMRATAILLFQKSKYTLAYPQNVHGGKSRQEAHSWCATLLLLRHQSDSITSVVTRPTCDYLPLQDITLSYHTCTLS